MRNSTYNLNANDENRNSVNPDQIIQNQYPIFLKY